MSTEATTAHDTVRQLIEETNKAAGSYGRQVLYEQGDMQLREGVKAEDFERFWVEEYVAHAESTIGFKGILLRVDRSEAGGHAYRSLWSFNSVAWRDRILAPPHTFTPLLIELLGPDWPNLQEKLGKYITGYVWTQYVEVSPKGKLCLE